MKVHAVYRRFILSNLREASLGTNLEALTRKAELEKNLVSITAEVKPLWGILDKLIGQENHALKVAKEVLSPRKNHLEKVAVETWFASDKWKELVSKFSKIYTDAKSRGQIGDKDFTEFSTFCRFVLSMINFMQIFLNINLFYFRSDRQVQGWGVWFHQQRLSDEVQHLSTR